MLTRDLVVLWTQTGFDTEVRNECLSQYGQHMDAPLGIFLCGMDERLRHSTYRFRRVDDSGVVAMLEG